MALQISLLHSHHHHLLHKHIHKTPTKPSFSPKPIFSIPPLMSSTPIKSNKFNKEGDFTLPLSSSRRKLMVNLTVLSLLLFNGSSPNLCTITLAQESLELERYTDSQLGFTLLRPSSYVKVDKAGANVLFEEVNKGTNNVGVVVNPVRLTSLAEFGTPEFVVHKLIQAEKRKESTKDAEVIEVAERSGHGGLQVYEFEYKVDSTRGGMKRIFSAAFVASKKLYLLNIAHSDRPESPLDPRTRKMLEEVLHSFDSVPTI